MQLKSNFWQNWSKDYVMVMLTILCHCIVIAILGLGDSVLCSPQVRKKWWKMKKSSSSQFFISLQKVARIVALPEGHVAVLQLSQTGEKWSMPPYTMLDLSFSLSVLRGIHTLGSMTPPQDSYCLCGHLSYGTAHKCYWTRDDLSCWSWAVVSLMPFTVNWHVDKYTTSLPLFSPLLTDEQLLWRSPCFVIVEVTTIVCSSIIIMSSSQLWTGWMDGWMKWMNEVGVIIHLLYDLWGGMLHRMNWNWFWGHGKLACKHTSGVVKIKW